MNTLPNQPGPAGGRGAEVHATAGLCHAAQAQSQGEQCTNGQAGNQ